MRDKTTPPPIDPRDRAEQFIQCVADTIRLTPDPIALCKAILRDISPAMFDNAPAADSPPVLRLVGGVE